MVFHLQHPAWHHGMEMMPEKATTVIWSANICWHLVIRHLTQRGPSPLRWRWSRQMHLSTPSQPPEPAALHLRDPGNYPQTSRISISNTPTSQKLNAG